MIDHSQKRFARFRKRKTTGCSFNDGFGNAFYFVKIELNIVKRSFDVVRQYFCTFLQLEIRYLFLEIFMQSIFNSLFDNLLVLHNRFGHAKRYHGPERQLKCVLFIEKIGSAKYEVEFERKLPLARCVKCRYEILAHYHLLDIVHKNV